MFESLKHVYSKSNIPFLPQLYIKKILDNYNIEVIDVQRIRSVYKIKSKDGVYCLKKVGSSEKKAIKSIRIMEYLMTKNFHKVAKPIYCITGEILVKADDSSYYLTNWIDAEEVDFENPNHVTDSVQLLAEFHEKAKGFNDNDIKMKSNLGKVIKMYNRKLQLMSKFKDQLAKIQNKSIFDITYQDNINYYIAQARQSIELLKNSEYLSLCEESKKEKHVCHNSFYYQNILKDNNNNYFIVDLESCLYDLPLIDLAKFLRRIMSRESFLWDFNYCNELITEYSRIRKINDKEYKVLLALLIFPYKFYRLGRKKYLKKKRWKEDRYIRKLNRVLESIVYKNTFIKDFKEYYDIKL